MLALDAAAVVLLLALEWGGGSPAHEWQPLPEPAVAIEDEIDLPAMAPEPLLAEESDFELVTDGDPSAEAEAVAQK